MKGLAVCLVVLLGVPSVAAAELRYALILGSDEGDVDEERLRFAERDATRVHETLRDVGGFAPERLVLLRAPAAAEARRALIALNDRLRAEVPAGEAAILAVYYSGHADETALHLGGTRLPLDELEGLVRGSAASFRLLVLDACRSGAVTRGKGGRRAEPFATQVGARLPGEGVVFLTATAPSEDAQESDELGGSFFTHHLVSALLGAADRDGDGAVTLAEAYEHAYAGTLRATSRTLAGTQHPSFRYEYRGSGDVVLSRPGAAGARGQLLLPSGRPYLVLRGGSEGAVVAEVTGEAGRRLSLPPGRYFVRGRGPRFLLEGQVVLAAGEERRVDEAALERFEYARLVRKGRLDHTTSISGGPALRSAVIEGASVCFGASAGVGLDLRVASLAARLGGCHGGFENELLDASTDELWLELRAGRAFDVGPVSLGLGVIAGASLLLESFSRVTPEPPSRRSLGATLGAGATVTRTLRGGIFVALETDGLTYFFESGGGAAARFALRASLMVGKQL